MAQRCAAHRTHSYWKTPAATAATGRRQSLATPPEPSPFSCTRWPPSHASELPWQGCRDGEGVARALLQPNNARMRGRPCSLGWIPPKPTTAPSRPASPAAGETQSTRPDASQRGWGWMPMAMATARNGACVSARLFHPTLRGAVQHQLCPMKTSTSM